MNTKVVGKTAKEVLDSFISNDFIKKLIPAKGEIRETMAGLVEEGNYYKIFENGLKKGVRYDEQALKVDMGIGTFNHKRLSSLGLSQQEADDVMNLLSNIAPDNVQDTLKTLYNIQPSNERYQKIINILEGRANKAKITINPNTVDTSMNILNYYSNIPHAYFNHPDKDISFARKSTAVGAYAAVAIGGRYLNGGTLTADSEGRRDIAGVPFL